MVGGSAGRTPIIPARLEEVYELPHKSALLHAVFKPLLFAHIWEGRSPLCCSVMIIPQVPHLYSTLWPPADASSPCTDPLLVWGKQREVSWSKQESITASSSEISPRNTSELLLMSSCDTQTLALFHRINYCRRPRGKKQALFHNESGKIEHISILENMSCEAVADGKAGSITVIVVLLNRVFSFL